jgi:hypothetical protein
VNYATATQAGCDLSDERAGHFAKEQDRLVNELNALAQQRDYTRNEYIPRLRQHLARVVGGVPEEILASFHLI